MTTENVKKAVRLEDRRAEAEAALAAAQKKLAEAEARISAELAEAKAAEEAAERAVSAARKEYDELRKQTVSRLSLTPAAAKRAVLAWAGLTPAEENEALIRGETKILDEAVEKLVGSVLARDPGLKVAQARWAQLLKERSRLYDARQIIERKTRDEERAVRYAESEIRELDEKIRQRDRSKTLKAATPRAPVSKEDHARFVEARRRLSVAASMGQRSSWRGDGERDQPLKVDPPFVWPPKEKV